MNSLTFIFAALLGGAISAVAVFVLIFWSGWIAKPQLLTTGLIEPCIFLYCGDRLMDATPPARRILASCSNDSLPALRSWLAQRFDTLDELDGVLRTGRPVLLDGQAGTGSSRMRLLGEESSGGLLRLTLVRPDGEAAGIVVDALSQQAMEDELTLMM